MGFTVKQITRAEVGGEMALVMFQAVGCREQRTGSMRGGSPWVEPVGKEGEEGQADWGQARGGA